MDITWLIILASFGIVAAVSTVIALLRERAPRVAPDPERIARLRDRIAEAEARRLVEQVEDRLADERRPREERPRPPRAAATERLWAGGL